MFVVVVLGALGFLLAVGVSLVVLTFLATRALVRGGRRAFAAASGHRPVGRRREPALAFGQGVHPVYPRRHDGRRRACP